MMSVTCVFSGHILPIESSASSGPLDRVKLVLELGHCENLRRWKPPPRWIIHQTDLKL